MLNILRLATTLSLLCVPLLTEAAFGNPQNLNYPVVSNPKYYTPSCYMQAPSGVTLDLMSLCQSVPNDSSSNIGAALSTRSSYASSPSSREESYGSSRGICNAPDDRAADGSRCGRRAVGMNSDGSSSLNGYPSLNSYPSSQGTGNTGETAQQAIARHHQEIQDYFANTLYRTQNGGGSTYVNGYTRADGTPVSGYFRSR